MGADKDLSWILNVFAHVKDTEMSKTGCGSYQMYSEAV